MQVRRFIKVKIIFTIKNKKIMKKLVFAAIAAMVMVSVSNVFANNKMASVSSVAPVDTVAPAEPADTTVEKTTPAETPADSTTATTDSTVAK
jgi:hypothetical protein